jgi:hypothetical protein
VPGCSGTWFTLNEMGLNQDMKPFLLLPNDGVTFLNAELKNR